MAPIGIFVAVVFLYSLVSRRLARTAITAPIVFTAAGLLAALGGAGFEHRPESRALLFLAEIGLVLTLFTDATHIRPRALRANGALAARLLTVGMLLTIVLGAVCARLVFPDLSWPEAGILAAILAPTDAGLGEVIVRSERVPAAIRQALNVEAGLNDGLAVPFLMVFIALAVEGGGGVHSLLPRFLGEQLGYGALIGLAVGGLGGWLLDTAARAGWMDAAQQALAVVALPLLCVVASEASGASMFIAAFVAGLALQVRWAEARRHSAEFSEVWGRLFDFLVFFLFGVFVAQAAGEFTLAALGYAVLSLTVVRMAPVALALAGSGLSRATVLFMGWFGPRGLASIVLGLVYLEQETHLPGEATLRVALMVTVLLSVLAHGLSAAPGIDRYARDDSRH